MVAGLYIDNGDGTVTDLRTNLTWQKRPADNGANLVTWDTAIDNANSLPLANGGWRLPNVYELQSLVDFSKTTGNLVNDKDINDNDIFAMPVGTNLRFWTSTTDTFTELRAWKVNFDPQTGHHHNSSLNNFKSGGGLWWAVRSIRSGG